MLLQLHRSFCHRSSFEIKVENIECQVHTAHSRLAYIFPVRLQESLPKRQFVLKEVDSLLMHNAISEDADICSPTTVLFFQSAP